MKNNIIFRLGAISVIAFVLLLPIGLIREVIQERTSYRYQAKADIAQSWSNRQVLLGPIIRVPYKQKVVKEIYDRERKQTVLKEEWFDKAIYLLPKKLGIESTSKTNELYRGIYSFPVYTTSMQINGSFLLEPQFGITLPADEIQFGEPSLVVSISDVRGISGKVQLQWGEKALDFAPGTNGSNFKNGIYAPLEVGKSEQPKSIPFSFNLSLRGMESISFAPIGEESKVSVNSSWPHPKFFGTLFTH